MNYANSSPAPASLAGNAPVSQFRGTQHNILNSLAPSVRLIETFLRLEPYRMAEFRTADIQRNGCNTR